MSVFVHNVKELRKKLQLKQKRAKKQIDNSSVCFSDEELKKEKEKMEGETIELTDQEEREEFSWSLGYYKGVTDALYYVEMIKE